MRGFDLQPEHIHCIFRRDTSWFALPALTVREVLLRPAIAHVPGTGPLLTGLCHVRSEFLPVFNLGPLLGGVQSSHASEAQMLVVISVDGNWGLLVDQVAALTSLETSVAAEGDSSSWFAAVLGWATYHDQVVRVLEPTTFYRLAEAALEQEWGGPHGEYRDGASSSDLSSHAPRQSSPPSDTPAHVTRIETIVGRN